MAKILEKDIEKIIQDSIISNGYRQSASEEFDRDSCLNKVQMKRCFTKY